MLLLWSLTFLGGSTKDAIFTTEDKTFDIKKQDFSNWTLSSDKIKETENTKIICNPNIHCAIYLGMKNYVLKLLHTAPDKYSLFSLLKTKEIGVDEFSEDNVKEFGFELIDLVK